MPPVNPEMVVLAREAEGLTLRELSARLSFGYSTLSRYESGLAEIAPGHLAELARELRRPESYFCRTDRIYGASCLFHRKRSAIPLREVKRIDAQVNELRIQSVALLLGAEIESDNQFFRLATRELDSPAGAARELRRLWQLPSGPIRSIVDVIESAGGLVFRCEFRNRRVDGVSLWPADDESAPPILCINEDVPGDRQRFTLAHEIGHVVMHHLPSTDHEVEADEFASEFLMPAAEIAGDLPGLNLVRAAELKAVWRVSMAAIIRRAFNLKKIRERQYKYLMMQMSTLGYRKCEPIPLPAEEPELFRAVLDVHRSAHRKSDGQMGEILGLFEHQFQASYGIGNFGLRLVV